MVFIIIIPAEGEGSPAPAGKLYPDSGGWETAPAIGGQRS